MNSAPEYPSYQSTNNEVSLRDLYLVLRRGFPLIAGVVVLFAVLGLVYALLREPSYQSESVTIVTPSTIDVQDANGISFAPRANVSFETYRALATSRSVVEQVLVQFPDLEMTIDSFLRSSSVDRLIGPSDQRPETLQIVPLSVAHQVNYSNPETSAALSNAWAESTLSTIRESVLGTFNPVEQITNTQLQSLRAALGDAENALEAFRAQNNLSLLGERNALLNSRVAQAELEVDTLERQLVVSQARVATLNNQIRDARAATPTSNPTTDTFLAGLSIAEAQSTLSDQRTLLATRRQDARAELDAFTQENNLALLRSRVERLNSEVGAKEAQLSEIPGNLTRVRANLAFQEARLAAEPQLLELRDTILANDALSEVAQGTLGTDLDTLLQTRLESEVVNPTYVTLLSNLIGAEAEQERLQTEAQTLRDEIAQRREQLGSARQELIALETEQELLQLNFNRINELYSGVLARAQQLDLAAQNPAAGERILRESVTESAFVPPVLSLEATLRAETLSATSLRANIAELNDQLSRDQRRLETLQREQARLERELRELQLERDDARSAYSEIIKLQPLTSYITELFPASAQLLSRATVPSLPEGSLLITVVLAGFIGGILALLSVILRAAVAPPTPPSDARSGSGQPVVAFDQK